MYPWRCKISKRSNQIGNVLAGVTFGIFCAALPFAQLVRASAAPAPCDRAAQGAQQAPAVQNTSSQHQQSAIDEIAGSRTVTTDLFTGTLSASISLPLPYGRRTLMPDLSLDYRSSGSVGSLGVGWQLEVGHIVRAASHGVTYGGCGQFQFVSAAGVSDLSYVAAEPSGELYERTVESNFTRFYKLGSPSVESGWLAIDRYGTRYEYGITPGARTQNNDGSKVFQWDLESITDIHGNVILFQYQKDNGRVYLGRISYTGDRAQQRPPLHTINFEYEMRPDRFVSLAPGFAVNTNLRLSRVRVIANSIQYETVELIYKTSAATGRSLLTEVVRAAPDGTTESLGKFDYVDQPYSLQPARWFFQTGLAARGLNYVAGDFDGTGRTGSALALDCVGTSDEFLRTGPVYVARPDEYGNGQLELWSQLGVDYAGCIAEYYIIGDFNGDGRADLLYDVIDDTNGWVPGNIFVMLGQTCGVGQPCGAKYDGHAWITNTNPWPTFNFPGNLFALDVEGNGKTDLLRLGKNGYSPGADGQIDVLQSTGSSFNPATLWSTDFHDANRGNYRFGDFNGDGRTDILHIGSHGELTVALSEGLRAKAATQWAIIGSGVASAYCFADFNGDGLTDVAFLNDNGDVLVSLSTGESFQAPTVWWASGISSGQHPQLTCDDLNGDGRADVALLTNGLTVVSTAISRGDIFLPNIVNQAVGFIPGPVPFPQFVRHTGQTSLDLRAIYTNGLNAGGQMIAQSNGVATDYLSRFVNSLGGRASVRYAPSSAFQNSQLPFSFQVVSEIALSSDTHDESKYQFSYEGGYFHMRERRFRGFRKVSIKGPIQGDIYQTLYTVVFHQGTGSQPDEDNPEALPGVNAGQVASETISSPDGSARLLRSFTYRATPVDAPGPIYFSPLESSEHGECDGDTCSRARTTFDYDRYGNATAARQFDGEVLVKSTIRSFVTNEDTNLLGLLKTERVLNGSNDTLSLTMYCRDGLGDVTQIRRYRVDRPTTDCSAEAPTEYVSTRAAYDRFGNLLKTTNADGGETRLTYDSDAVFPLEIENALSQATKLQYYGVNSIVDPGALYGLAASITDANGTSSHANYDSRRRITAVTVPGESDVLKYEYDFLPGVPGYHTSQRFGDTRLYEAFLDGFGRTRNTSLPGRNGEWIDQEFQYTGTGKLAKVSDPFVRGTSNRQWTVYEYDALDRLTTATKGSNSYRQCYGPGTVGTLSPSGIRRVSVHDSLGRLQELHRFAVRDSTCSIESASSAAVTTFSHDANDLLTSVRDAEGKERTIAYDLLGRRILLIASPGLPFITQYDDEHDLEEQDGPGGNSFLLTFDKLGRQISRVASGLGVESIVTKWKYDAVGGLSKALNQNDSNGYEYDKQGRLRAISSKVFLRTRAITMTYTNVGDIDTIKYPNGSVVKYNYDGGLLSSVELDGHQVFKTQQFDSQGRAVVRAFSNGMIESREFDGPSGKISKVTVQTSGGQTLLSKSFNYEGEQLTRIVDADADKNVVLIYDGFGRLKHVGRTTNPYEFDYNRSDAMTYHGEVGVVQYGDPRFPQAPTTIGNDSFFYNHTGNRFRVGSEAPEGSATLTFDAENKLAAETALVNGCDGRIARIKMKASYRPDSQLSKLKISQQGRTCGENGTEGFSLTRNYVGALFAYEGFTTSEVWIPIEGSIGIIARMGVMCRYITKDCPIEVLFRDPVGNVLAMSNRKYELVKIETDPFGGRPKISGDLDDIHTFRTFGGNEYFAGLNLQSFYFRWYDPSVGQFIGPDPVARRETSMASLGSYGYGKGDPYGKPDRLGLFSDDPDDPDDPGDGGSSVMPMPGLDPGDDAGLGDSYWSFMATGGQTPFYTWAKPLRDDSGREIIWQPHSADKSFPGMESISTTIDPRWAMKAVKSRWDELPPGARMIAGGASTIAITYFTGGSALLVEGAEVSSTLGMIKATLDAKTLAAGSVTTIVGMINLGMPPKTAEQIERSTATATTFSTSPPAAIGAAAGALMSGPAGMSQGMATGALFQSGFQFGTSFSENGVQRYICPLASGFDLINSTTEMIAPSPISP
jgi:RHS repeat-associated protein